MSPIESNDPVLDRYKELINITRVSKLYNIPIATLNYILSNRNVVKKRKPKVKRAKRDKVHLRSVSLKVTLHEYGRLLKRQRNGDLDDVVRLHERSQDSSQPRESIFEVLAQTLRSHLVSRDPQEQCDPVDQAPKNSDIDSELQEKLDSLLIDDDSEPMDQAIDQPVTNGQTLSTPRSRGKDR